MSNVQKLRDANAQPEQGVVDVLTEALELAKSGELRGVVVSGDLTGNAYYAHSGFADGIILLGHLDLAKQAVRHGLAAD